MGITGAVMVPHPPLIIPEIGKGREREISETIGSCRKAAGFLIGGRPETVIVLSPHHTMYADYFHISSGISAKGNFSQYDADEVRFEIQYDTDFISELCRMAGQTGFPAGVFGEQDKKLDHGTMVPLYFIRQAYEGEIKARFVRIGLSGLPYADHYKLGVMIRETAVKLNRRTAVVASGDLSHRLKNDGPYGFEPEGPEYDEKIMRVMQSGLFGDLLDFDEAFCEKAGECGHRSFVIMAGCFDGENVKTEKLSYEGPFGVGYGVVTFAPGEKNDQRMFLDKYLAGHRKKMETIKQNEDPYVRLARRALETYVLRDEKIKVPDHLPVEMTQKRAGTFVSIKKHGQLRGCIGTISASTGCIAEEIIGNAISSASNDPRFQPVTKDELEDLVYSVDILSETEGILSEDELDVKRYGVIVTAGKKRGLLLPNLKGIETVGQQISVARKKAGIRENEKVMLQRFEVVRHQ